MAQGEGQPTSATAGVLLTLPIKEKPALLANVSHCTNVGLLIMESIEIRFYNGKRATELPDGIFSNQKPKFG
jgi:hypothetical protein